jgi:ABC-2 type transport system permease protein
VAFAPVLHSEWIKIRTLRSLVAGLADRPRGDGALLRARRRPTPAATTSTRCSRSSSASAFGQIAAIAFGTTAVSSEFQGGALRVSLAAVPHRGRWFAAKATAIAVPVLAVGLVTGW